jgi:hypothetical protein
MIRIAGILSGAAAAIAMLILVLGLPTRPTTEIQAAMTPSVTAPTPDARNTVPEPRPAPVTVETVPAVPKAAMTEPASAVIEPTPLATQPPAQAPVPSETHWYVFWSPFHTEIAANGFVAELQRTTGLDYRVVRIKPGVFEVAFAYSDDADAADKLAQIADASGLDVTAAR